MVNAEAAEPYVVDWRAQERRPFRRGFMVYGPGEADPEQVFEQRRELGISVVEDPAGEDATPPPAESFEELGVLPPWLLETLQQSERVEPSPLQAQALPIALAGQNLVVNARPSLGQAAALLILAAVHMEDQPPLAGEDPGPVVLLLTHTQELAAQVAQEADSLLRLSKRSTKHPKGFRCVNVSGGGARSEKLKELGSAGAHIVVGTPKRVHDMASKEQISLLRVTLLALDGVERVLELGHAKEVGDLAGWVRPERQTVLLASTWPRPAAELSKELCFSGGPPVHIDVKDAPAGAAAGARKRTKPAGEVAGGPAKASRKGEVASTAEKGKDKTTLQKARAVAAPAEEFPDDW